METPTPNQTIPELKKFDRKPALEASVDPGEAAPGEKDAKGMVAAPTMIIIASASPQTAVDFMTKFNQMFGNEARFSIATDSTNTGGWHLTLAFGEVGCHFRADFVEPILEQIADKMCEVQAGRGSLGDGDPVYKVQPPSWQEVDAA